MAKDTVRIDLSVFHETERSDEEKEARNLSLSESTWRRIGEHAAIGNKENRRGQASQFVAFAIFVTHALLSVPESKHASEAYNLGWTLPRIVDKTDWLQFLDNIGRFSDGFYDGVFGAQHGEAER